ncbi:bifunctional DNA primase/polymerase [Nocardia sp. NPDC050408]|uniref:bifunctional DNA primase/polymerase n=1 Tax=Nocardia sp. NPDC050408 TaxID=3364319 RepID=UPI0037AAF240
MTTPLAPAGPDLLTAALDHAERGFHIFPLHPATKLPAIKRWEDNATRDLARIRRWWRRWPADNLLTGLTDDTPAWNVTSLQTPCTRCASAQFRRLHDTARRYPARSVLDRSATVGCGDGRQ